MGDVRLESQRSHEQNGLKKDCGVCQRYIHILRVGENVTEKPARRTQRPHAHGYGRQYTEDANMAVIRGRVAGHQDDEHQSDEHLDGIVKHGTDEWAGRQKRRGGNNGSQANGDNYPHFHERGQTLPCPGQHDSGLFIHSIFRLPEKGNTLARKTALANRSIQSPLAPWSCYQTCWKGVRTMNIHLWRSNNRMKKKFRERKGTRVLQNSMKV